MKRSFPVGNVENIYPSKEVIKSNVDTKDENRGRNRSYAEIFIHQNMRRHGVEKEMSCDHPY